MPRCITLRSWPGVRLSLGFTLLATVLLWLGGDWNSAPSKEYGLITADHRRDAESKGMSGRPEAHPGLTIGRRKHDDSIVVTSHDPAESSLRLTGEDVMGGQHRIRAALRRQGIEAREIDQLTEKEVVLYPEVVEILQDWFNWVPELMKASSSVILRADGKPSLLSLDDLEPDSILWDLGLRTGDVLALIDGRIAMFDPRNAAWFVSKAKAGVDALHRGDAVTVTVMRQGQPVHLVYQSW